MFFSYELVDVNFISAVLIIHDILATGHKAIFFYFTLIKKRRCGIIANETTLHVTQKLRTNIFTPVNYLEQIKKNITVYMLSMLFIK